MIYKPLEKLISRNSLRDITIGVEIEVYLIDCASEPKLVRDESLTQSIYEHFDERVYKDAQDYQIEIRTNPSDEPNEVSREICQLMKKVDRVAKQYQCRIAPVGFLKEKYFEGSFCGLHIHIRPKSAQTSREEMKKLLLAIYPFIYTIARLSLSSPFIDRQNNIYLSKRILESDSIAPLDLKDLNFLSWKYLDITINTSLRHDRERIKDVETIEVRVFDPVGSSKCLQTIIQAIYQLSRRARTDFIKEITEKPLIFKTIQQAREDLIKPKMFIDPLTRLTPYQFLKYLNVRTYHSDSWIRYHFRDWLSVCNVDFHTKYSYPL